ncbi:CHAT domain-containing tetratricopeptide repeat protein [Brasilonema bromeliae]|uniref:CHAT domain-containing tetratricopeptide repeat protein n=1 Tax=Brasilonema bromeliae TaxID=383615 RepID=UPI001FE6DD52|nr:tetratricopeptide repeat protein [Brasilonema bromeliae]
MLSDSVVATPRNANLQIAQQSNTKPENTLTPEQKKLEHEGLKLLNEGIKLANEGTLESKQQAIQKDEAALKFARQLPDKRLEVVVLQNIGAVYSLLVEYNKALEYEKLALAISREQKLTSQEADTLWGLGVTYSNMDDNQKALENFNLALSMYRSEKQPEKEADTLKFIAKIYEEQFDKHQEAIQAYKQALALQQNDPPSQASTYWFMGTTYWKWGENKNALDSSDKALEIYRRINDISGQVTVLEFRNSVYTTLGENQKALEQLQQAQRLLQQVPQDRLSQASILVNFASTYRSLGEYQKALDYLQQARSLSKKVGARQREISALRQISSLYQVFIGEYGKALDALEEALTVARAINNRVEEAEILNNQADIYASQGEYQKALDTFNQALTIQRQLKIRGGQADTLSNMAKLYRSLGDYQQSINTSQQALDLYRQLGDRKNEVFSLSSIGDAYHQMKDYPQAIEYYNKALSLSQQIGGLVQPSLLFGDLGRTYLSLKEYDKALNNASKSLSMVRQQKDKHLESAGLALQGKIYREKGDYQQALLLFEQSKSLIQQLGNKYTEAGALRQMGKTYNSLKQYQTAIDNHNQELAIRKTLGNKAEEAATLYQIAVNERDRGNLQAALTYIKQTTEIIEGIRTKVTSQDLRSSYFATVQDYYQFYIDLLMRLHKKDPSKGYDAEALHISERSRARSLIELLTEAHANIRKGADPKLLAEERRLQFLLEARQKRLASLFESKIKVSEQQIATLNTEIANLLNQYRELETKIRTNTKYANLKYPNPLTLPQIQQQLDKDTLLLQYSLGEERSYLWAVTPNSVQSYELAGRKEIEQKVEDLRKLLSDSGMNKVSPEQTAKAADQLSQLILAPVAKDLGQKRLLIVADGALQYIPFTVLTVPQSSVSAQNYQPLLLNHEIVSLPSATTIDILRQELKGRQKAPKTLAILADPVFSNTDKRVTGVVKNPALNKNDQPTTQTSQTAIELDKSALMRATRDIKIGNFLRIEGTRKQAEEIMKLVSQPQRLHAFDFDANYTWATNPQLSQYRYLLFATHGILNEINPELSGIVLSQVDKNGNQQQKSFLQLPDLFNLDYPAELLVLSACETGLGKEVKGEGLLGLTRGLMYAGAARVVVSLWKVDYEATSKLMSEFYKEILQQGKTPAAAMRAAQLEMWQQEEWRNPYSWAAFTLQGEWR